MDKKIFNPDEYIFMTPKYRKGDYYIFTTWNGEKIIGKVVNVKVDENGVLKYVIHNTLNNFNGEVKASVLDENSSLASPEELQQNGITTSTNND